MSKMFNMHEDKRAYSTMSNIFDIIYLTHRAIQPMIFLWNRTKHCNKPSFSSLIRFAALSTRSNFAGRMEGCLVHVATAWSIVS